jgi:RNA polymerase sigma factor (sigma-70 family)
MLTILQRVADGDQTAVRHCLEQYGGMVWALARRMSGCPADAEDAAQEIFIDLWRNAKRFDPSLASEPTFVAMIARRRLIDRQRARMRTPHTGMLPVDVPAVESSDINSVVIADEAARARSHLALLKPVERQVIELAVDRGLSQTEIASALGLPLGTIKSHARRGLCHLRTLLAGAPAGSTGVTEGTR